MGWCNQSGGGTCSGILFWEDVEPISDIEVDVNFLPGAMAYGNKTGLTADHRSRPSTSSSACVVASSSPRSRLLPPSTTAKR